VLEEGRRSVLILRRGVKLGRPVLVYFDGSEMGLRALSAAAQLARADHDNLLVLLAPAAAAAAGRQREQAQDWLRGHGLEARFRQLSGAELANLGEVVRQEGGQVLVLGAEGALGGWGRAEALIGGLAGALVLVR
jgi:predicted phosphoribosyltransferase